MRSLNNEVEDVVELIQDYKMDVMFMAGKWHDPESISISKLRSRVLWSFRENTAKTSRASEHPAPNHGRVAVAFNSMFRGMLLKLT